MTKTKAFAVVIALGMLWFLGLNWDREVSSAKSAAPAELKLRQGGQDPNLNQYQGIEAHIEAIKWGGKWFKKGQDNGISQVGGFQDCKPNKLIFDPDLPDRGLPDLIVTVGEVRFFEANKFLANLAGRVPLPRVLLERFSGQEPYKTWEWEIREAKGKRRARMDLYLLEFDLLVQVQPAPEPSGANSLRSKKHPVTGEGLSEAAEYENQRYGDLDIALKLIPKSDIWYFAAPGGEADAPRFGVAATEVLSVKFDGDPVLGDKDQRIGAFIERGQSLALYDSIEDAEAPASQADPEKGDYLKQPQEQVEPFQAAARDGLRLNPGLFAKEKYGFVHIQNIGAWEKGRWNPLEKNRKWADQIQAKFLVHAFVVGEWVVKKPDLFPGLDSRKQWAVVDPSFWSKLLPSFGLGSCGKAFSGGGLVLVVLLVLGLFFPPILTIVNAILGFFAEILKRLLGLLLRQRPSRGADPGH